MKGVAIITGGGTGLGRAIALELAQRGFPLLIVGRRVEPLQETAGLIAGGCETVAADIATATGRKAVVAAVGDRPVSILVHNAAVLRPVGPLATVAEAEWRQAMQINVDAPLFLTQALLPRLSGGRILHISSGAARSPLAGWGAYCVSKAAFYMLYQMLNAEHADVATGSVRPGVVDTPMQELIRSQSKADFPAVERFRQLQQEGQLRAPEDVASFIAWVLTETTDFAYRQHEWDINDPAHTADWLASQG